MSSNLSVGFWSEDITPSVLVEMAGFAARVQPAEGVHDSLSVRALAVSDGDSLAVLAAVDLIGVDARLTTEVRTRVRADLAEAVDYLAVVATHTHGGPAVLDRAQLGEVDVAYRHGLVAKIASAVVAACRVRRPAVLRFGLGREASVGRNRRDPRGPIDPDLPVLRADDAATGAVLGAVCSYACHPVTLGPDNRLFTRDYPGYLVDLVKYALDGAPVLFATGCCGQINTGHSAMDSIHGRGFERRTYAEARRLGTTLAGAAMHALGRSGPPGGTPDALPEGPLRVGSRPIELPILPTARLNEDEVRALELRATALLGEPGRYGEAVMAAAHARWARTLDPTAHCVTTEIGVISLGPVAFVLLPGEVFVEMGLELKERFPELRLVTVSYANDATGYLPHRSAYAAGGYEVDTAFRHYGFAGPYTETAGDLLVHEAAELLNELSTAN